MDTYNTRERVWEVRLRQLAPAQLDSEFELGLGQHEGAKANTVVELFPKKNKVESINVRKSILRFFSFFLKILIQSNF